MNPLVSIITPTYNRCKLLHETISSVFKQTYRPLEFIIIDDGSTDGTVAALLDLQVPEGISLQVLTQDHCGAQVARNAGMDIAQGEYIQFLDSDDLLFPEKIERQVKEMIAAGADLSFCQITAFEQVIDSFPVPMYPLPTGNSLLGDHIRAIRFNTTSALYSYGLASAVRWDESLKIWQDLDFNCSAIAATSKIVFIEEVLAGWRNERPDSTSTYGRSFNGLIDRMHAIVSIETKLKSDGNCCSNVRDAIASRYRGLGVKAAHAGNSALARKSFLNAFWRSRSFAKRVPCIFLAVAPIAARLLK